MLNTKKIENDLSNQKIGKAKLCANLGIARSTLDSILNGADARISTIEAIAKALGRSVGYFFDEEVPTTEIHTEGDFSPASESGAVTVTVGDAVLAERVRMLEELVKEKSERIEELKERITELKERMAK